MAWPIHDSDFNVIITVLSAFVILSLLFPLFITNRLNFGPSTIAFVADIIFGPSAGCLLNLLAWINLDTIVLECSRIVIGAQCFANGIELPEAYIGRHWRSIAFLVVPVMMGGWVVAACFVKVNAPTFEWQQCLACTACFNSIDHVLAATVLSGKFSNKVPKHIRDHNPLRRLRSMSLLLRSRTRHSSVLVQAS